MVMIKLDDKVLVFSSVRGCFLTSSLIGTLALSLTIPLSILADICMQKVRFPRRWAHRSFSQKPKCRPCFYVDDKVCLFLNRCASRGYSLSEPFPSFSPSSSPRSCVTTTTGTRFWSGWGDFTLSFLGNIESRGTSRRNEPQSFSTESFLYLETRF